MADIHRLQAYLRQSAMQLYKSISVSPFTIFLHPEDRFEHFNYAIPDIPISGDLSGALADLRETFIAHERTPRFEFIAEFAPDLASALHKEGFIEESEAARASLMVCTPETYRAAPDVADLVVTALDSEAAVSDIRAVMLVQHEGFNSSKRDDITDEEVANFRAWLGNATFFLARLAGQPVGVGSLMPPVDGLAEIAGIATLPNFRRRGIASKLTDYALQTAFSQDIDLVLLTAGDESAGRVYQRVGFRPVATALAYRDALS